MSAVIATVEVDCPDCGAPFDIDLYATQGEMVDGELVVNVTADTAEVELQTICCGSSSSRS